MKIGNHVKNIHTGITLEITGIDHLLPEQVEGSDLGLTVYTLANGARWNETPLREHWRLEPVQWVQSVANQ